MNPAADQAAGQLVAPETGNGYPGGYSVQLPAAYQNMVHAILESCIAPTLEMHESLADFEGFLDVYLCEKQVLVETDGMSDDDADGVLMENDAAAIGDAIVQHGGPDMAPSSTCALIEWFFTGKNRPAMHTGI